MQRLRGVKIIIYYKIVYVIKALFQTCYDFKQSQTVIGKINVIDYTTIINRIKYDRHKIKKIDNDENVFIIDLCVFNENSLIISTSNNYIQFYNNKFELILKSNRINDSINLNNLKLIVTNNLNRLFILCDTLKTDSTFTYSSNILITDIQLNFISYLNKLYGEYRFPSTIEAIGYYENNLYIMYNNWSTIYIERLSEHDYQTQVKYSFATVNDFFAQQFCILNEHVCLSCKNSIYFYCLKNVHLEKIEEVAIKNRRFYDNFDDTIFNANDDYENDNEMFTSSIEFYANLDHIQAKCIYEIEGSICEINKRFYQLYNKNDKFMFRCYNIDGELIKQIESNINYDQNFLFNRFKFAKFSNKIIIGLENSLLII